jgi:hypothetical protein
MPGKPLGNDSLLLPSPLKMKLAASVSATASWSNSAFSPTGPARRKLAPSWRDGSRVDAPKLVMAGAVVAAREAAVDLCKGPGRCSPEYCRTCRRRR